MRTCQKTCLQTGCPRSRLGKKSSCCNLSEHQRHTSKDCPFLFATLSAQHFPSAAHICSPNPGYLRTPQACASATPAGGSKRAVVLLPGLGNNSQDYKALGQALEERGLIVQTAAVTRVDWLRNAAGLRQVEYWKGTLQPRPVVDWCAHLFPNILCSLAAISFCTSRTSASP